MTGDPNHRINLSSVGSALSYYSEAHSGQWNGNKIADGEPLDLGPTRLGDSMVGIAKHDEEPLWSIYVLSHKVNKTLRFSHRYIDRIDTGRVCATLNTGIFYTEQGQAADWTPDTYASVLGNAVLYNYIVEMMMPAEWQNDPPVRERVRLWPIYDYNDGIPDGYRIARGNGLVRSFAEGIEREAVIQALIAGDSMVFALEGDDDTEKKED